MTQYRIYLVGASGRIAEPASLAIAKDDADALEAAVGMLSPTMGAEVWQLNRLVWIVPPLRTKTTGRSA